MPQNSSPQQSPRKTSRLAEHQAASEPPKDIKAASEDSHKEAAPEVMEAAPEVMEAEVASLDSEEELEVMEAAPQVMEAVTPSRKLGTKLSVYSVDS